MIPCCDLLASVEGWAITSSPALLDQLRPEPLAHQWTQSQPHCVPCQLPSALSHCPLGSQICWQQKALLFPFQLVSEQLLQAQPGCAAALQNA